VVFWFGELDFWGGGHILIFAYEKMTRECAFMEKLTIREKAEVLRQLGHPVRLAILEELMKGGKCVTDIRDLLDVPQPNVSQHLTVLRQQRIVDFTEDGKLRCYFLRRPSFVRGLFDFISGSYPEVEKEEKDEPVACCSN